MTAALDHALEVDALDVDPAAASYLRFLLLTKPELPTFATDDAVLVVAPNDGGGLAAILGPRVGRTLTAASGAALASATRSETFAFAMGPQAAMSGFVAGREGWRRVGLSQEMVFRGPPALRPTPAEVREPSGPPDVLLPPFDAWMNAFVAEVFEGPMRPPPVNARDLWTMWEGAAPVSMAGALTRGPDAMRVVTVYTPPALRGRGHAATLVAAMAESARACGITHITLDYSLDTPRNPRTAYERAGFRPTVITERWRP